MSSSLYATGRAGLAPLGTLFFAGKGAGLTAGSAWGRGLLALGKIAISILFLLLVLRCLGATAKARMNWLNCIACGSSVRRKPYFKNASISLFACEFCGSLTALPRPSAARQFALHDDAEYFEHPYFERRRHRADAIERRCRAVFAKIATAIDVDSLRGQRHLDIGCDTGNFVLSAARI